MNAATLTERATPPRFLFGLALALIFVTPGQLAHALDPKHGPFIALADVVAAVVGGVFMLWVLFGRVPGGGPAGLRGEADAAKGPAGLRGEAGAAKGPAGLRGRLCRVAWPPLPVWAWIAVAVLSALGAASLKAAALEIIQLALYFGVVYMLFANVLVSNQRRRIAVWTLLLATTLVVAHALVQYFTAGDPQAVKALFQSRTAYSGYLALVLPLFFGLVLWSELTWERVWGGIVCALGGLTILAPPVIWVVAVVFVAMSATWGRNRLLLTVTLSVAIFMVATTTLVPLNRQVFHETLNPYEEGHIFKVMRVGDESADAPPAGPIIKKRWIEWMPALNMLADNFVLGVGAGNYQLNIGQPQYYGFLPNVKKSEPDTNNLYLVTAGSMGLAGLVCLLAFLGHFWRLAGNLWMHAQSPFSRALACGLYGACLALLLVNIFTSVFVRGTALAWALIFALVTSLAHEHALRSPATPTVAPLPSSK